MILAPQSSTPETERELRDRLAALIMMRVGTGELRHLIKVRREGVAPIVAAFDHELLSEVIGRIQWAGGFANLFIISGGKPSAVLGVEERKPTVPATGVHFGEAPIHHDASLGMFLEWAAQHEHVSFSIEVPGASADISSITALAH